MANLGYWQMKAFPGVWYLQLAPGRSSELYALKDDGDGGQETTLSKRIIIDDLRGKLVHMEVIKKKGKEHEKLLVSADEDSHSQEKKKVMITLYYFVKHFPLQKRNYYGSVTLKYLLSCRNTNFFVHRETRTVGILIFLNGLLDLLVAVTNQRRVKTLQW